jgi:CheY-like chemotaxis protein
MWVTIEIDLLVSYGPTTTLDAMPLVETPRSANRKSLSGPADSRRVVLVVEDDPDALDAIIAILEDAGYDALRAANGSEALRQLADHDGRCDLILLDLLMPVMNGWDFRRKQKDTPAFADIPVLLMSAGAHMATVSGELNAAGTVTKPVEVADLLAVVQRHCP